MLNKRASSKVCADNEAVADTWRRMRSAIAVRLSYDFGLRDFPRVSSKITRGKLRYLALNLDRVLMIGVGSSLTAV